jgi:hypothetical protein
MRYSQLEQEMLEVVFGITHFRQYVLGRPFEIIRDHKPLITIVRKPCEEVPPRLQRCLVALMPYQFSVTHVPVCRLVCTDALSRAPLAERMPAPEEARSMREYVGMVMEEAPIRVEDIQQASAADPLISRVVKTEFCISGDKYVAFLGALNLFCFK